MHDVSVSQAEERPPAPDPSSRRLRSLWRPGPAWQRVRGSWRSIVALAVAGVLGGVVGALVVVAVQDDAGGCPATTVARDVLPSVVTVLVEAGGGGGGNGSGALIKDGGYVLTNHHVVAPAAGGRVSIRYSDGSVSTATVLGSDLATDLAVVKAEDGASERPVLEPATDDPLEIGQRVFALGAPLGLSDSVTAGIVSALGRYVSVPAEDGALSHLLDSVQTDASINPGNSGGPLVDCDGRQVGVNTAISTVPNAEGVSGGGSVGLGFAVPMSIAAPIAEQLIDTGQANHPTLGLDARAVSDDPSRPVTGLEVTVVQAGGPAADAGLAVGDVITEIDGAPADSAEQLVLVTLRRAVGDRLPVVYRRDGEVGTTEITLG